MQRKLIEYHGEMLTLYAISQKEGISDTRLRKNYSKAEDIYEAVRICKEIPAVEIGKIEKIEYCGRKVTIEEIAREEGLVAVTLRRYYYKTREIYTAVEQCIENSRGKVQKIEYKNGEMLAISVIAKREKISLRDLTGEYARIGDIFKAVEACKELAIKRRKRLQEVEQNEKEDYYGRQIRLKDIAKLENLDANKLRRCFNDTKDVYRAVFMAKYQKQNSQKVELEGTTIDLHDMSLLIGVKYGELVNLLNKGLTIKEIKERHSNQDVAEKTKLAKGQIVLEFCVEKNLNFSFIFRAIYTYGKKLSEAVSVCQIYGKSIPINWIYENYGEILQKLEITGIQENAIIYDLRNKKVSLDEAIEGCVVRKNARKNGLSTEWGDALYSLVKGRELIGEEFHSEIQINENERDFINECETELSELRGKMQENLTKKTRRVDEEQGL